MRGKRLSGASAGEAAAVVAAGEGVAAGAAARILAPGAVLKKAGAKGKPTRPRLARRKNSRRGESGVASVDESVREREGESAMGLGMGGEEAEIWKANGAGVRVRGECITTRQVEGIYPVETEPVRDGWELGIKVLGEG